MISCNMLALKQKVAWKYRQRKRGLFLISFQEEEEIEDHSFNDLRSELQKDGQTSEVPNFWGLSWNMIFWYKYTLHN